MLGFSQANRANATAVDHALFSVVGLLAIAAPFAAPYVRHPRARALNGLPLAYLLIALVILAWKIGNAGDSAGVDAEIARGFAGEVASAVWGAVSLGVGAYLLAAASVFLAYQAVRAKP